MKIEDYEDEVQFLAYLTRSSNGEKACNSLADEDFHYPETLAIFREIKKLIANNLPFDLAELYGLSNVSGSTINDISMVTPDNISDLVVRLKGYSLSRKILKLIEAYSPAAPTALDPIDFINEIKSLDLETPFIPHLSIDDMDDESFQKKRHFGYFPYLDLNHLSYEEGSFFIIGARPGIGKTTFMLNLAFNLLNPCAIFSYEMTASDLFQKLMNLSGLSLNDKATFPKIRIVDRPLNLRCLEGEIKKSIKTYESKVIFIDYLQLIMQENKNKESFRVHMMDISRTLKQLALEFKICIIGLAQLNRIADNEKPQLSHLKESASFEADSDVVILLSEEAPEKLGVHIRKNRRGKTSSHTLFFNKERGNIENLVFDQENKNYHNWT